MPPARTALALALLLPLAALTGCFRGGDEPTESASLVNESVPEGNNATLPDDRGQSAGILETNKTEEGAGGVDHEHDYWAGRDNVELLNRYVQFSPTPIYPDGEGTPAKSVAYVKLPCPPIEGSEECAPMLVYEGAESVTVTVRNPTFHPECVVLNCVGIWSNGVRLHDALPAVPVPRQDVPHPKPPSFFVQYRSAADSEWRDPQPVTVGTPLVIPVTAQETDMPHSVRSLWVFRISTDSSAIAGIDLSITTTRGREVVDWPGHPDFYADTNVRTVADKDVSTKMSGVKEGYLYDGGGTWAAPDKLVSHGTTKLIVIANVSSVKPTVPVQPTGFFLEYHDATIIGPEITFGTRLSDADGSNDLASYNFEVPVEVNGMDGPYQPASRWGFRLMATFTDVDIPREVPEVGGYGVGLCPACFEYSIDYHLTVIAIHEPEEEQPAA